MSREFVVIPLFLCWGSFLNVLAYRLTALELIGHHRSVCPSCRKTIAWHDNIPIVSWFFLSGRCRHCKKPISLLYPFIELFTALSLFFLLKTTPLSFFPAYFIFFSALIITIRTDIETMLISRFVSLFLIPLGIVLSFYGYLPITFVQSITGALTGYTFLWLVNRIFILITSKPGIGQGDIELMGFIGSFIGTLGWWITLMVGCCVGSIVGIAYMLISGKRGSVKMPFGPFLAGGALAYVLCQPQLIKFLIMNG